MLIISKEQVEELIHRLGDPKKLDESRDEVKKMLEIKSTLLWRADCSQSCCGSVEKIQTCLTAEIETLEAVLGALDEGDIARTQSLLREYISQLEQVRP